MISHVVVIVHDFDRLFVARTGQVVVGGADTGWPTVRKLNAVEIVLVEVLQVERLQALPI